MKQVQCSATQLVDAMQYLRIPFVSTFAAYWYETQDSAAADAIAYGSMRSQRHHCESAKFLTEQQITKVKSCEVSGLGDVRAHFKMHVIAPVLGNSFEVVFEGNGIQNRISYEGNVLDSFFD